MGRKLDALLGRNFKASKFKTIAKLAISRLAILKNQRQARYSHAKSDVVELLKIGDHERALLRVEYVMEEENMLDGLAMIENYCQLLIERVSLIQKDKECPDELKEAISSLIFASSRCGEFPELRKIREIFSLTYGREFAARAVELRNNCGVQPRMTRKFSSRQPSLESRLKVLKDISTENGITLQLEDDAAAVVKEQQHVDQKIPEPTEPATFTDPKLIDDTHNISENLNVDEELSESVRRRKQYRDVAAAARDAFESAAYAAIAARAAVELSKSESNDYDSDDGGGSNHLQGISSDSYESLTASLQSHEYTVTEMDEGSSHRLGFDKVHPIGNFDSETEGEDTAKINRKINPKEVEENERKAERGDIKSASNSNEDILSHGKQFPDSQCQNEKVGNKVDLDDDDYDTRENHGNIAGQENNDLDFNNNHSLAPIKYQHDRQYNGVDNQYPSGDDGNDKLSHRSPKVDSMNTQDDPIIRAAETKNRMANTQSLNFKKHLHSDHSSTDWKKLSMRTISSPRV